MTIRINFPPDSAPRPPATRFEQYLAAGLLWLCDHDRDHATVDNGVGFNKLDSRLGELLAIQFRETGMLAESDWRWVARAIPKYRRQIGTWDDWKEDHPAR